MDLGTTYSVVAYVDDVGRPTIVRGPSGETTASVVYFENESNIAVGSVAKESAVLSPDSVVSLVKRQMGNADYSQTFFGKTYTAPAISALILQALAGNLENEGRRPGKVVITVPAYFGMLEKEATRQAGEIAGLDVAGIVPEPVAAALSYGLGGDADGRTVLVYDLGGGTFDVTIMRIGATAIEVLAVGGSHDLGGANWDEALFEHLLAEVSEQIGDDSLRDDDSAMQDLWNQTERTKKELSSAESRTLLVRQGGGIAKVVITRAQFEQLTSSLVEQTIEIARRTVQEAEDKYPGVTAEISEVLLVGGSCWMPAIQRAVGAAFDWPVKLADPDLAVAKGAAIYAAGQAVREILDRAGETGDHGAVGAREPIAAEDLKPETRESIARRVGIEPEAAARIASRTVVNVLPKAVGVKLVDTSVPGWERMDELPFYVEHLVAAQTQVPFTPAEPFTAATITDNQDGVEIEIWEQAGAVTGSRLAENHRLRGGVIPDLGGLALPAGSPVSIHFNVDAEGLVRLTATEPVSGKKLKVEAKIQLLSDEQVVEAKRNLAGLTVST
jgi:molecular chaperone DnaK (HSP70)